MQAILRKINSSENYSFTARIDDVPHLYDKWHFHPELELSYLTKSKGTRFVGDHIEQFEEGNLILIGAFLPHVWKNDVDYYAKDSTLRASAKVIQFLPDFFGRDFLKLKEMENINNLFERAKRGISIQGKTKELVIKVFSELIEVPNGIKRIGLLLEILEIIAVSDEIVYLSSQAFVDSYHRLNNEKINKVYEFTLSQYNRKILIEEAAMVANMSVSNFCKYFKHRTQKTYIQFLTEVRIGFACRMLIENKKNIQQIAFDCGFHNLSNFIRSFKIQKKQKPAEYRQAFGGLEN